jgi:hypothetical protein
VPPEELRRAAERLGRVDGAVDEQPRRRPVPLGEHLRAILEREQPVPSAANDLVERGDSLVEPLAETFSRLENEDLATDLRPFDRCEEDAARARLAELR